VAVEIGGDVAVRGRGPGPWVIGVSDRLITTGANRVSPSSTAGRDLLDERADLAPGKADRQPHHRPAHRPLGRTVPTPRPRSARVDCVSANAFATAALLWGEQAGYHIAQAGWSARLVRRDGSIDLVGGWPEEAAA
jgi:FAD:protein FMN transferase